MKTGYAPLPQTTKRRKNRQGTDTNRNNQNNKILMYNKKIKKKTSRETEREKPEITFPILLHIHKKCGPITRNGNAPKY